MRDSADFFTTDYDATLFPLRTNLLLVQRYAKELRAHLQERLSSADGAFQSQQRVFATKTGWFVRRTVKLDPVAEFFIYDLVYRNRSLFRRKKDKTRTVHGFTITSGRPTSVLDSYVSFKRDTARFGKRYPAHVYMDIAAYFNHIYHHDLVQWFEMIGAAQDDVTAFGKFLREIATGRSVDCLPQGLYATKMIGSAFLSFLEDSPSIRAAQSTRLMDDLWLFDKDARVLHEDAFEVQALLSERGLFLNEAKTSLSGSNAPRSSSPIGLDAMKLELLRKRREKLKHVRAYGGEGSEESEHDVELGALSKKEQAYLVELLKRPRVDEEDAELVLTLMRDHSKDVVAYLPRLLREFPALVKRLYYFCQAIADKNEVVDALLDYVAEDGRVTEFQLFWFGMMTESYLLSASRVDELLHTLYEHGAASRISKAKILEIPEQRFGLPDLRGEQLRAGQSDWLAWASAVGSRKHPKGQRNQMLKYFRRSSRMNELIGNFVADSF